MKYQVDIKGFKEARKKLGLVADDAATMAIRTGIFVATKNTQEDARAYISSNQNSLTAEQRSAAAQTGAAKVGDNQLQVQTGRLQNGILVQIEDKGATGVVYSNVEYARIHELGGYAGKNHKVLIPARPYLGPAFFKNIKPMLEFIKQEFIGRLKQIAREGK